MNMKVDLETNTALHSRQAVLAVQGGLDSTAEPRGISSMYSKGIETGHCCCLYRTLKHMR